MNQAFDQDRVDRWLRESFHREGERIVEQMPRSLLPRCLAAVRTHAERHTASPVVFCPLDWASVAALAIVVVAGAVLWSRYQPPESPWADATPVLPVQPPASEPLRLPGRAVPGLPTPQVALAAADVPAPAIAVRTPATPFTPHLALANAPAARPNATWSRPVRRAPVPGGVLTDHGGTGTPSSSAGTGLGGVIAGVEEPLTKSWNLEPPASGQRGGGLIVALATPAPTTKPAVNIFTVQATDLEPHTPFVVLVQVRGQPNPIPVGVVTSDPRGTVAVNVPVVALAPGGTAGRPLMADIVGIYVQNQQTGEIVLQTTPPAPPPSPNNSPNKMDWQGY